MAKSTIPLTLERLKEVLDYNPETGIFTWKHRPAGRATWNTRYAGKVAGCIDCYGYVKIAIDDVAYRGHRLAWFYMTGAWPLIEADHENLNKADNRFSNLREATKSQNATNRTKRSDNTSGFKGVSYQKQIKKWVAQATLDGTHYHFGCFDTPEEAHARVCEELPKLHGEFSRT
jgi:hypothetical protein